MASSSREPLLGRQNRALAVEVPLNSSFPSTSSNISGPPSQSPPPMSPTESVRRPFVPQSSSTLYHRMKYYSALSSNTPQYAPPGHVLPSDLFTLSFPSAFGNANGQSNDQGGANDGTPPKTQGSITTIFSMWNTMMGTSVLALPWGFAQAGLLGSILVIALIGSVTAYTAVLVVKRSKKPGDTVYMDDYTDLSAYYLGQKWRWIAWAAGFTLIFGATLVYNILIDTAFLAVVNTLSEWSRENVNPTPMRSMQAHWDPDEDLLTPTSAALIMAAFLIPLSSLKDLRHVVRFNSLGLMGVLYVIAFIIYDTVSHGLNLSHLTDFPLFQPTIVHFAGMLNASFFIHNLIAPIIKNTANPDKNPRDTAAAFFLVGSCYTAVGLLGFLAYHHDDPDMGTSLPQNFLELYSHDYVPAFIARTAVFLQLITIFPLLVFTLRKQWYGFLFGTKDPSTAQSVLMSIVILSISTAVAIFYPYIGTILRFIGAVCGFLLVYTIPVLAHLQATKMELGYLPTSTVVGHSFILLIGFIILVDAFL